jgi:oxygen-independent coproporphyrinogen-3 oxidase
MDVDTALIQRHRRCAPHYDIYPASDWFVEAFDATALDATLAASAALGPMRAAIDLRLPAPGSAWAPRAWRELPALLGRDIALHAARLAAGGARRATPVDEVHLTWHDAPHGSGDLSRVLDPALPLTLLRDHFDVSPHAHCSVTVSASGRRPGAVHALRAQGFQRIEIRDDGKVCGQADGTARVRSWVHTARTMHFSSIGAGFVYGASGQTSGTVRDTLGALLDTGPTYVVLCHADDHRRGFRPVIDRSRSDRSTVETMSLLVCAARVLAAAGYRCIGQDLYARTDDPLAVAHRQGRLLRKSHGASLRPVSLVLGIGPGAIGTVGNAYYQNHGEAPHYRDALMASQLPVKRGTFLGALDMARRAIIQALVTDLFVDLAAIENTHRIDFASSFAEEVGTLRAFEDAGLLLFDDTMIELTDAGRLIAGSIAMVFDDPLNQARLRMPLPGPL